MKEHIDELLNGYVDGELPEREHTEVLRLIKHDPAIALRLRQFEKMRMLVNSMPPAEAPANMVSRVMAALDARTAPIYEPTVSGKASGARHLFVRKLMTVAAMFVLVGVLGVVVYTILKPGSSLTPGKTVTTVATHTSPQDFYGRLELEAPSQATFANAVLKVIDSKGLRGNVVTETEKGRTVCTLTCSRNSLKAILSELADKWQKLDSATLVVETGIFGRSVTVDAVTPKQIEQILGSSSTDERVAAAKQMSASNRFARLLPAKNLLPEVEITMSDLKGLTPVLTSGGEVKTTAEPIKPGEAVHLTIVIAGR
jgi:negative regulator of sigma E activity